MSNFKSAKQHKAEKYAGKFFLENDGDFADVIFLYRNEDEMLIGDAHYIKSQDYAGYVECNGAGCAACRAGIRKDTKLFVPLYNIQKDCIEFWDRRAKFDSVLHTAVFKREPNPSNVVYRITRHGAASSRDTRYELMIVGTNDVISYDDILKKFNMEFPTFYSMICKEVPNDTLAEYVRNRQQSGESTSSYSSYSSAYQVTPRVSATVSEDYAPIDEISDLGEDDFEDNTDF